VSRIAILHPTTLLGREVRMLLEGRPHLWSDLTLLSTDRDEIGRLTDAGGAAAVVVEGRPDDVGAVDLLFVCGDPVGAKPFLDALPAGATAVVVSAHGAPGIGRPVVAGLPAGLGDEPARGEVLRSPHPGAVLLTHLLAPLAGLGLVGASATLVQPTSLFDDPGLDDLFEQTRGILAMRGGDSEMFGRQLAFNLLPSRTPGGQLAAEVAEVLELPVPVSVQLLQGGVFHGMSVSLHLELSGSGGAAEVRDALEESTRIEVSEEPDLLGPIDAAAQDRLLLGHVIQDRPGSIWVWAVMDNLTRGGALNAVEIAERLAS
jgi:aspartate-semialdehyde dehydrogenase